MWKNNTHLLGLLLLSISLRILLYISAIVGSADLIVKQAKLIIWEWGEAPIGQIDIVGGNDGHKLKETYDNWQQQLWDPTYFQDRVIFAPTHEEVDKVNARMMSKLLGRETVYYSSDTVSDIDGILSLILGAYVLILEPIVWPMAVKMVGECTYSFKSSTFES
ncbi:ATP-dependent DNA helicase PIF1-like protein [Tanacetum coccineum]